MIPRTAAPEAMDTPTVKAVSWSFDDSAPSATIGNSVQARPAVCIHARLAHPVQSDHRYNYNTLAHPDRRSGTLMPILTQSSANLPCLNVVVVWAKATRHAVERSHDYHSSNCGFITDEYEQSSGRLTLSATNCDLHATSASRD